MRFPRTAPCDDHRPGQVYYTNGWQKPDGMCDDAWKFMMEYAVTMAHGAATFITGN